MHYYYYYNGGAVLQSACIFSSATFQVPASWYVHDMLVSANPHRC